MKKAFRGLTSLLFKAGEMTGVVIGAPKLKNLIEDMGASPIVATVTTIAAATTAVVVADFGLVKLVSGKEAPVAVPVIVPEETLAAAAVEVLTDAE